MSKFYEDDEKKEVLICEPICIEELKMKQLQRNLKSHFFENFFKLFQHNFSMFRFENQSRSQSY